MSDQPRTWSRDSSSSQEEFIVYPGNTAIQPERQPKVPPAGYVAQKDEGFVRFLKKHSSPTHQRVTAGGRIVPMEQRPRPPNFSLSQPSENAGTILKPNNGFEGTNVYQAPMQESGDQARSEAQHGQGRYIPPQLPGETTAFDKNSLGLGMNMSTANDLLGAASIATTAQSPTYPLFQPAPLFSPMSTASYALHSPPLYPMTSMAFDPIAFQGPYGVPYMQNLFYTDAYGLSSPQFGFDEQSVVFNCQHQLATARATFEELDMQVKSIDRHRAMNNLEPHLAQQRLLIVQQRADTKAVISAWEQKLAEAIQSSQKSQKPSTSSSFNVQAPSYVPQTSFKNESNEAKVDNGQLGSNIGTNKVPNKTNRRIIPIVTPPEMALSHNNAAFATSTVPNSVEVEPEVNEWGERLGRPPPEIERQQSDMLEAMIRDDNTSPQALMGSASDFVSMPSSNEASFDHNSIEIVTNNVSEPEDATEWLPTQRGRAPATVEASYELQLDAMRLPTGFVSTIRLPDGTEIEVPGRGLRRPPSFEMDDFERQYWTKKPILTKEMTAQFEVRHIDEEEPEDGMMLHHKISTLSLNRYVVGMQDDMALLIRVFSNKPMKDNATDAMSRASSVASHHLQDPFTAATHASMT
jgi:hypothetical protein